MDCKRDGPGCHSRREHSRTVFGRGVQHELSGLPGSRGREAGDERLQLARGHGEDHEFAALDEHRHVEDGRSGEHGLRAFTAGL